MSHVRFIAPSHLLCVSENISNGIFDLFPFCLYVLIDFLNKIAAGVRVNVIYLVDAIASEPLEDIKMIIVIATTTTTARTEPFVL